LEFLGKGITAYFSVQGQLPPFLIGPKGHKHSWRALVAPYVLFDGKPAAGAKTYGFDQPWDSENNRNALSVFFEFFIHCCPLDPSPPGYPFFTSYLMLVRPLSKNSETGEMKSATLANDAVLIVESVDCGIQFAEPRDLLWEDLWEGDSPFGKGKLNSVHPKVVKALRVDGKAIDIPKNITKDKLRKLLEGQKT
jgi:hypothetical protein